MYSYRYMGLIAARYGSLHQWAMEAPSLRQPTASGTGIPRSSTCPPPAMILRLCLSKLIPGPGIHSRQHRLIIISFPSLLMPIATACLDQELLLCLRVSVVNMEGFDLPSVTPLTLRKSSKNYFSPKTPVNPYFTPKTRAALALIVEGQLFFEPPVHASKEADEQTRAGH